MQFQYVGYDLDSDTLIATNSYEEWYCGIGNSPQRAEYFGSVEEALKWLEKHPDAHKKYHKDLEEMYFFLQDKEAASAEYMENMNSYVFEEVEREKAEALQDFLIDFQ